MFARKPPCRRRLLVLVLLASAGLAAAPRPAPAGPPAQAVPLTPAIIRTGLKLLAGARLLERLADLGGHLSSPDIRLTLGFEAKWLGQRVKLDADLHNSTDAVEQLDARLAREHNSLLRAQLEVLRERARLDRERNELALRQLDTARRALDYQVRAFRYSQSVLRKEDYAIPADKLVVVVADFSSSDPGEGREIADEIAVHLNELRKHGLDVVVLVGEVQPGVVIRSEEMARDVGRHFPAHTSYVVVWGTLSPRTVGRYRPHLTCVQKIDQERGVSTSLTLSLASQELPLKADPERYQRECYERLVGVTCAAIPTCYAASEIQRERIPNLDRFYAYLREDAPRAKGAPRGAESSPEVAQLRKDLEALTDWTRAREEGRFTYLQRLDAALANTYPQVVRNTRDDGLMVLIRDDQGRPRRFRGPAGGKDVIVYIDVTETTNQQYVQFLNAMGKNGVTGGARWIKLDPDFRDIREAPGRPGRFEVWNEHPDRIKRYQDSPVIDVSWFGAAAYCRWAGKELPTREEWELAARGPEGSDPYPWGKGFRKDLCHCGNDARFANTAPVGTFPKDRSKIGCFDMAGNVAEWCADWFGNEKDGERVVCGGSYRDTREAAFGRASVRRMAPHIPERGDGRWIGFRGVVRVPVPPKR
jgi:hypothetical protein